MLPSFDDTMNEQKINWNCMVLWPLSLLWGGGLLLQKREHDKK